MTGIKSPIDTRIFKGIMAVMHNDLVLTGSHICYLFSAYQKRVFISRFCRLGRPFSCCLPAYKWKQRVFFVCGLERKLFALAVFVFSEHLQFALGLHSLRQTLAKGAFFSFLHAIILGIKFKTCKNA